MCSTRCVVDSLVAGQRTPTQQSHLTPTHRIVTVWRSWGADQSVHPSWVTVYCGVPLNRMYYSQRCTLSAAFHALRSVAGVGDRKRCSLRNLSLHAVADLSVHLQSTTELRFTWTAIHHWLWISCPVCPAFRPARTSALRTERCIRKNVCTQCPVPAARTLPTGTHESTARKHAQNKSN